MNLPKTQAALLTALQRGDRLHYIPYAGRFNPNAYYFLSSTMKRCTAAAVALQKKGLVVNRKEHHYDRDDFHLTETGKEL